MRTPFPFALPVLATALLTFAALPATAAGPLTPGQMDAASQVFVGTANCEFNSCPLLGTAGHAPGDDRPAHEPAGLRLLPGQGHRRVRPGAHRTLIKAARAEAKNSLLFDNGDLLQGSPLGDYVARIKPLQPGEVHPAYKVMNALGYDAANVGNHEFNYGLPFLSGTAPLRLSPTSTPTSCRTKGQGRPAPHSFTPYVILERRCRRSRRPHTLKVGVIGFVPPQIMQWDQQHLKGRCWRATSRRPRAARAADEGRRRRCGGGHRALGLRARRDGVLRRKHRGPAGRSAGVDAILFGHSHGEFPGRFFNSHAKVDLARGTINGVPATMPGFWGSHLGVIDLVLEKRRPLEGGRQQGRDPPRHDRATRKPLVDPTRVAALIAPNTKARWPMCAPPWPPPPRPSTSYFAQVADDPSVQLVSQAQLAYARRALAGTPHEKLPLLSAAAPFKTGGRGGGATTPTSPPGRWPCAMWPTCTSTPTP
jgi:2',3'-cyclic-nucleotide 2'-phosphodiesterase/3'-nucleotidase